MREIKLIEGDKQIGVIYKGYGDNLRLGANTLKNCFDFVVNDFSRSKEEIECYMRQLNALVPLLHAEVFGDGKFWETLFNSSIFADAIGKVEYFDKYSVEISFNE